MKSVDNYARSQDAARLLFLKWDQEAIIARGRLAADEESIRLNFLGQPFRIHRATGAVENCAANRPANFSESLSIYDYLCRTEPLPLLTGRYRGTNALKHVPQSSPSATSLHQRWADRFQQCLPQLRAALAEVGAAPFPQGDAACVFPVFDALPAVFQFWEGDEEFPPPVRFLWDENTPDCLKFETLYYVMGCFLERVAEVIASK